MLQIHFNFLNLLDLPSGFFLHTQMTHCVRFVITLTAPKSPKHIFTFRNERWGQSHENLFILHFLEIYGIEILMLTRFSSDASKMRSNFRLTNGIRKRWYIIAIISKFAKLSLIYFVNTQRLVRSHWVHSIQRENTLSKTTLILLMYRWIFSQHLLFQSRLVCLFYRKPRFSLLQYFGIIIIY